MVPTSCGNTSPVPPPAYHRAQAKVGRALQVDALTLVTRLHLLALCRLAVQQAQRRCPPPLPAGPGGRPRCYTEESLLLVALLRTLWRLPYQDVHDWLVDWPALAIACGLPCDAHGRVAVPSPAQQCKRAHQAGAPPAETLFVLLVHWARKTRLIGGRDVVVDSAPILAWRRSDPDAAVTWYESFVVSLTAFHGRGFFATTFQPGDPQAGFAALEAVIGLLIEISFIATFTQRFFGSK